MTDEELNEITPGIRRLVSLLNRYGFKTTDSGDGKANIDAEMGCAMEFPNIAIKVDASYLIPESHRLADILRKHGVTVRGQTMDPWVPAIQAMYDPGDCSAVILLTGVDDSLVSF